MLGRLEPAELNPSAAQHSLAAYPERHVVLYVCIIDCDRDTEPSDVDSVSACVVVQVNAILSLSALSSCKECQWSPELVPLPAHRQLNSFVNIINVIAAFLLCV